LHLGCSPLSLSSPSSLFFFRWWRWWRGGGGAPLPAGAAARLMWGGVDGGEPWPVGRVSSFCCNKGCREPKVTHDICVPWVWAKAQGKRLFAGRTLSYYPLLWVSDSL
jgi:hypothetical protein